MFHPQALKRYFSKNAKLFLFGLLIIGGLLINLKPALALFGVGDFGVFDLNMLFLDALDVCDSMVKLVIQLYLLILATLLYVGIAAGVLEWAVSLPINLGSGIVASGWSFMVGIANIVLVVALLVIALAYILRLESYNAKKMLPKFILVAILINFSLLFVRGLVDISHFVQNTLLSSFGPGFITSGVQPIMDSLLNYSWTYLAMTLTYLVTAFIPYVNAAALVFLTVWILVDIFYSGFAITVLLLIIASAIATIMNVLIFVFLARIAMVWILAIFSPVAFAFAVFPVGKKSTRIPLFDFNRWLKMLTEWLISGIIILFLLGLGFKFIGDIIPFTPNITIEDFQTPNILYPYLFLLVYLGIVSYFAKQYTPELAGALMNQAQAVWNKGRSMWKPGTVRQRGITSAGSKAAERYLAKMELKKAKGEKLSVRERIGSAGARAFRPWRPLKTTAAHEVSQRIEAGADELKKDHGKNVAEAKNKANMHTAEGRISFATYAANAKGAAGLSELEDEELKSIIKNDMAVYSPDKIKDVIKHRPDLMEEDDIKDVITKNLVSDEYDKDAGKFKDKNVQAVLESGIEIDGKNVADLVDKPEDRAKIVQEGARKKVVDSLKEKDIDDFSEKALENNAFAESLVRWKPHRYIRKLSEAKGNWTNQKINEQIKKLGEELIKTNSAFVTQTIKSPGYQVFHRLEVDDEKNPGKKKEIELGDLHAIQDKQKEERAKKQPAVPEKEETWETASLRVPQAATRLKGEFSKEHTKEGKSLTQEEEDYRIRIENDVESLKKKREKAASLKEKLKELEEEKGKGYTTDKLHDIAMEIKNNEEKLHQTEKDAESIYNDYKNDQDTYSKKRAKLEDIQKEEMKERRDKAGLGEVLPAEALSRLKPESISDEEIQETQKKYNLDNATEAKVKILQERSAALKSAFEKEGIKTQRKPILTPKEVEKIAKRAMEKERKQLEKFGFTDGEVRKVKEEAMEKYVHDVLSIQVKEGETFDDYLVREGKAFWEGEQKELKEKGEFRPDFTDTLKTAQRKSYKDIEVEEDEVMNRLEQRGVKKTRGFYMKKDFDRIKEEIQREKAKEMEEAVLREKRKQFERAAKSGPTQASTPKGVEIDDKLLKSIPPIKIKKSDIKEIFESDALPEQYKEEIKSLKDVKDLRKSINEKIKSIEKKKKQNTAVSKEDVEQLKKMREDFGHIEEAMKRLEQKKITHPDENQ